MTNIATLFCTYPDAVGLLKGLYVMSGYFDEAPLPKPYYNWNSWADSLASKIVFASNVFVHRAIPLEVTDTLTLEAKQTEVLLNSDSDLMKAISSFGKAWLESSEKLTYTILWRLFVFFTRVFAALKGAMCKWKRNWKTIWAVRLLFPLHREMSRLRERLTGKHFIAF